MRRTVTEELAARHLPDTAIDDVVLLVTELVGNAVCHADPLPGGVIEVQCSVAPAQVRLEVVDGGSPSAPQPRQVGAEDTSGRGLAIVDRIAGEWGVQTRSRARTVWVVLSYSSDGWPASPTRAALG